MRIPSQARRGAVNRRSPPARLVRRHVLPGQATIVKRDSGGPNPNLTVINEAGLYRAVGQPTPT